MSSSIVFQPITIATASPDSEGRLVLVNGALAAVLVRLADEIHAPELRGSWFVEVAFGHLSDLSGNATFATLEEAADRFRGHLTREYAPAVVGALSEGD